MIDIGPRLDSRLRDKFARIDAVTPPQSLTSFQPHSTRRRPRTLNVIVGVAAIAVVGAAAVAFALELGGHPHPTPATSSAQGGPLPSMPIYSAAPRARASSPRRRCPYTARASRSRGTS